MWFGLSGQTFDAETLAKMKAEKEALAAKESKEQKKRVVTASKDDILMQNGTVTTCSAFFYDSGGATGDYANYENFTLTLLPATAGAKIKVQFTEFSVENNYDFLKIYDGTSTNDPQLANLTGTTIPANPYIASNAQGALTFMFTSDNIIVKPGWKATVSCYIPASNDLEAVSLNGSSFATQGIEQEFTVTVKNWGSSDVAGVDYTVELRDNDNNVLATSPGVTLTTGSTFNIPITWTPTTPGNISVLGVVVFAADEVLTNNQTALKNIQVYPAGTFVTQVGEANTFPPSRIPFDYYYKNSASQTIYTPAQLGIAGGIITAIAYKNNFATSTIGQKPVKIWIGETTETNMSNGWIDPSTLTLVYDGNINTPGGVNDILITLQNQYVYQGGNLVIYTYRGFDPSYYSSSDSFYGTEVPGSNCTRRYSSDTQFDPNVTPTSAGTVISWVPNTTLFFSTAGLGFVEGTVTSEGNPLAGVKVQIIGSQSSKLTNASGFYRLSYLQPGNYNIVFSKQGYHNDTAENVTVVADDTTIVDMVLNPIQQYTVSGTITASDTNLPLEGVNVKLEGYENYVATTDANGYYEFANVYGEGLTYVLTAQKTGYQDAVLNITVENGNVTQNIILNEIPYPPKRVTAAIVNDNALVTWFDPFAGPTGSPQWLKWDNGTNYTSVGTGSAANFDVAHRYSPANLQALEVGGMSITKIQFYPNEAAATYTIRIWTGGTPSAPATLAYSQVVSNPTIAAWNEVILTTPFIIDDTQELWIGYNVNTTTGYPAGTDAGPQVEGFGNMMYFQGTWSTLTQLAPSLTYNWNIAAWVDNAKMLGVKQSTLISELLASQPKFDLENVKIKGQYSNMFSTAKENGAYSVAQNSMPKSFENYTVYRLLQGQDPSEWTQLATNVADTFYIDNTWNALASGLYQYAVVANYTNGVTSPAVLSNVLPKDMEVAFTVNITTNSNDPATNAVVTLVNQDGDPQHVYTLTSGATGVTFPAVWRGVYDLTITLAGFNPYNATGININNTGLSHSAQLIEIINEPYGLMVTQQGNNALFSWNNFQATIDDMESYENFIIQNIGNYTMVDVDGSATYSIQNVTFPNQGYVGSFIVFNPSATSPALTSEAWLPHSGSKYLGCFAATTPPNNDWLITEPITVTPGLLFSFWGKSVTDQYGLERFKVGVSTTGAEPSNFTIISGANYIEAPITWTKYSYPLNAYVGQTVRLAIQCVSNDAFVFMVDDLGFEVAKNKSFSGYNVYLDGNQVASGIQGTSYTFQNVPVGQHTAGVRAVYTSGQSSIQTISFNMDAPQYTVTFTVKNIANAPIAGASIAINNTTLTTNAQGIATINLVDGTYSYTVSKTGYNTITDQLVVNGANLPVNVILTGVEDAISNTFAVYPNPANNSLNVARSLTSPAVVEIYSNNGTLLKSFEMNETTMSISISDLNSGVYFLRLIENENTSVQRFIKK